DRALQPQRGQLGTIASYHRVDVTTPVEVDGWTPQVDVIARDGCLEPAAGVELQDELLAVEVLAARKIDRWIGRFPVGLDVHGRHRDPDVRTHDRGADGRRGPVPGHYPGRRGGRGPVVPDRRRARCGRSNRPVPRSRLRGPGLPRPAPRRRRVPRRPALRYGGPHTGVAGL